MTPKCLLLPATALLLLAGCAVPASPSAPAQPAPAASCSPPPQLQVPLKEPAEEPAALSPSASDRELQQALQYADHVRGADAAALTSEISRLDREPGGPAAGPLHLALALMHTRQPADTARALGQVQRVLDDDALAAVHPLARLLEGRLLQQRRLEEQLDRQARQLREAQQRNEQLGERLEAMRKLERSLNTRPARATDAAR